MESLNKILGMSQYEPVESCNQRRRTRTNHEDQLLKKVLIVDDSVKALTPLNIIFRNLGCETVLSFDGTSSIREIIVNKPDLIVLDWSMPDMSGGEAIVRAQNLLTYDYGDLMRASGEKIPIVTFSAHPSGNIRRPDCVNFQFLEHWQKPLSYAELTLKAAKILNPSL